MSGPEFPAELTHTPVVDLPSGIRVAVSPGAGYVDGTFEQAAANMRVFIADLALRCDLHTTDWQVRITGGIAGRHRHELTFSDGRTVTIDMPGWPIDQVRYLGEPGQSIRAYPRLYVNGGSWVWTYALTACKADH